MKKAWLPVLLMIISLAGLLWSRAILSLSAPLWIIWLLTHTRKDILRKENMNLLIWGISPVFIALLGCWQHAFTKEDLDHLLTLSTYSLAAIAAGLIAVKYDQNTILKNWVCTSLIAISYSFLWYANHYQEALTMYGSGQTVPVWMDNDHVRFGMFLAISCFLSFVLFAKQKKMQLFSMILLFAVLLLAIRTAWVMIMVMVLVCGFLMLIYGSRLQKRKVLLGIVLLMLLFFMIYHLSPGVQQKIAYTLYDWQQFNTGKADPTLSDATRRIINNEAWKLIQEGKSNIGWSAIDETIRSSIQKSYPEHVFDFGWPFNQWLFWWMGSGIVGLVLFSLWFIYPIIHGIRKKNIALSAVATAILVSCFAETNIAYQYSVWIHAWSVSLLWSYPAISVFDNYENQKV